MFSCLCFAFDLPSWGGGRFAAALWEKARNCAVLHKLEVWFSPFRNCGFKEVFKSLRAAFSGAFGDRAKVANERA